MRDAIVANPNCSEEGTDDSNKFKVSYVCNYIGFGLYTSSMIN